MMRVLQVVEPGLDGVFRHVEGLVTNLLARGVPLDLAYSSRRSSDRLFDLVRSVEVAGGQTLDLGVGNGPEPRDLGALFRLDRLLRHTRPSVVHAHSSKAGGLVRLLGLARRTPACFYTPNAYYGMSGRAGLKASFFNRIERWLGSVGTTINVSPDEAEWARQVLGLPASRQRVIPNAVDVDRFAPGGPAARQEARRRFQLPPEALVVGTAGRFSFQKDPVTLYRAMARLLESDPNLWLLHLGRGELADELETLARDTGLVDRLRRVDYLSDPRPFYEAIDIFALTSRYEGLSFAILEALAFDLPLLLTRAPGNAGFEALGLSHLEFAEPGSSPSVAEGLLRLRQRLRSHPGLNHRQTACAHFSVEAAYGRLFEAYREAAGVTGAR